MRGSVSATSREPLRITAELIWRLLSRAVPDLSTRPAELLGMPAVQLFAERAQAVQVDFQPRPHRRPDLCACGQLPGVSTHPIRDHVRGLLNVNQKCRDVNQNCRFLRQVN